MEMQKTKIQKIALEKVIFLPEALRGQDEEKVAHYKEDILRRGLLNLMTVSDNGDGTFTVTDGGHRTKALQELASEGKWEKEWTYQIKSGMTDMDILADQLSGNHNRSNNTNKETINAIHRIATQSNMTFKQIAEKAGMTEAYLKKLMKTTRLPESVQDAVSENKVSIANFISLSNLAGRVPEDELLDEWVTLAGEQTAKDFSIAIQNHLDKLREEAKGGEKKAVDFEVKKKLISREALEELLVKAETDFNANSNKVTEAKLILMQTIWSIDEKSIADQRAAWDAKQAEKAAKAEERKRLREEEKKKELLDTVKEMGYDVTNANADA